MLFRNSPFSKFYYKLYLHFLNFSFRLSNQPVIVYQMGKVGSSTIVESLRASGLNAHISQVHFLTANGLQFLKELYQQTYGNLDKTPPKIRTHFRQSQFLSQHLSRNPGSVKKYKIVTLVRDPIATNISGFFQNADLWLPELRSTLPLDLTDLERISARFFSDYPHEVPLKWFDMELKQVFEIDVFAETFQKSKGYHIYTGKKADVLLLKLESLEDCGREAFREFLHIEDFTLRRGNSADKKSYAATYNQFIDYFNVPQSYLDLMYGSKYAQHFYSFTELGAFKLKWLNANVHETL